MNDYVNGNIAMTKRINKRQIRGNGLRLLPKKYVVQTNENYRGLSYDDIIIRWHRWLLSDKPDQQSYEDIQFLRGSVGYHKSKSSYLSASVEIPQGTGILVPIVTTHYNLGEHYQGLIIQDEFSLRRAVREHVDAAGPFWAILEMNERHPTVFKLVQNLESFRVESMPFELNISEHNPFLNKMDEPTCPGIHTAMVAGYFVLLRKLPVSSYKIRFGGYGMDGFFTDSLYAIRITPREKIVKDVSSTTFSPTRLLKEKKAAIRIGT